MSRLLELYTGRLLSCRDIVALMFSSFFSKSRRSTLDLEKVQAVFFDLDGTLIDVDMNQFVPSYLHRLTEQMGDRVNPARVTRVMHQAVAAMFANTDATRTLENILLDALQDSVSITSEQYAEYLELFCENDLEALRPLVKGHSLSPCLVESCLARGWQVVLATNPIFPRPVIDARIAWGQLEEKAFHHVTSYETAHFCKPNPAFFEEILARLQVPAGACLMVGNDTLHDLSASQVGMQTCLLTPWSIKRPGVQFKADWQGRHDELLALIAPESSALASWSSRPD